MNIQTMQEKLNNIRCEQEASAQVLAIHLFKFASLEAEARNIEASFIRDCSPPEMRFISFLKQLCVGVHAALEDMASYDSLPPEMPEVTASSPVASFSSEIEPESPSPTQYLDLCFGPPRDPMVTPFGRVVDFNSERCVRCIDNGSTLGPIRLSWTEWEVSVALFEAGDSGLTLSELAAKVTRWRDVVPSNEAVQRIVSKVTAKFDDAGLPFRGRTENVNPTISKQSKKRRRGRPPKPGDGQFRAYLYEASPCNQSS